MVCIEGIAAANEKENGSALFKDKASYNLQFVQKLCRCLSDGIAMRGTEKELRDDMERNVISPHLNDLSAEITSSVLIGPPMLCFDVFGVIVPTRSTTRF
jgi:hypothetical protein